MWHIDRIDTTAGELDFTSSGQGRRRATTVVSQGVRLINAVELVDVDPTATQVHVCEACGFTHCEPGGWVAFRRLGSSVVWIPCWNEMEKGALERVEYLPPPFMAGRGAPAFTPGAWTQLTALLRGLPAAQALPALDSREAVRLIQWSAPGHVLGAFPEPPRLMRDALVAVSQGDVRKEALAVDAFLERCFSERARMEELSPAQPVVPVKFFLDLPGTPPWAAFGHTQEEACLLIEGGPAITLGKPGRQ